MKLFISNIYKEKEERNLLLCKKNVMPSLTSLSLITTILLLALILLINLPKEIQSKYDFISSRKTFYNERFIDRKISGSYLKYYSSQLKLNSNLQSKIDDNSTILIDDDSTNIDLITTTTTTQDSTTTTTISSNGANASDNEPSSCAKVYNYRLPSDVLIPTHYDLIIMPDLTTSSYDGAVQINLKILKQTNEIILHSDETLNIEEIYYLNLGSLDKFNNNNKTKLDLEFNNNNNINHGSYVIVKDVCRDSNKQLLIVTFMEELKANSNGLLHITFSNELNDESFKGFYKSSYMKENSKRYHAVTQFQATSARTVFPCFDEPIFKTSYDLTLIVTPSDRLVLSNTRIIHERLIEPNKERNLPQRKLVKFARTPPMSSYLLAFVVGEFDYVEDIVPLQSFDSNKERKLRLRVYTPLGKQEQGKFALQIANKSIIALERYFKIEYPLKKLDLIAIPDFDAGAMENWGLLTFKPITLLTDLENTSFESYALVAITVVHEIAHQWFGNLVTMKWWNDLWLNEGFATWMEYELANELMPNLDLDYHYLLRSHIRALSDDSFRQVHAIETQSLLEDTTDIDSIFDFISYNKAAAVIRFLHDDLYESGNIIKGEEGEEEDNFQKAIRVYLEKFKYNSTDMNDFLKALTTSSNMVTTNHGTLNSLIVKSSIKQSDYRGEDLEKLLESWITQSGHPILKVNYSLDTNELHIEQERFISGETNLDTNESKQTWIIPVSIVLSTEGYIDEENQHFKRRTNEVMKFVMHKKRMNIKLPDWWSLNWVQKNRTASFDDDGPLSWLKINANFSGFYRVLYPIELLRAMKPAIERREMSPQDRLNLLDEAHTLFISDKISSDILLELISWYSNENHGAVIDTLATSFNGLLGTYEHDKKMAQNLTLYGQKLLGNIYEKFYDRKINNETLMNLNYYIGKGSLLSSLVQLNYSKAVSDCLNLFHSKERYPIDFRKPVYMAVSKYGSHEDFMKLFELFNKTDSQEERFRLANAIAKAITIERINIIWNWLNSLTKDDLEDRFDVLSSMLTTKIGSLFVLELFETKIEDLIKLNDGKSVNSLLEELSLSLDPNDLKRLNHLFIQNKNSYEWKASLYYIKKMSLWQKRIQQKGRILMEKVFESNHLI